MTTLGTRPLSLGNKAFTLVPAFHCPLLWAFVLAIITHIIKLAHRNANTYCKARTLYYRKGHYIILEHRLLYNTGQFLSFLSLPSFIFQLCLWLAFNSNQSPRSRLNLTNEIIEVNNSPIKRQTWAGHAFAIAGIVINLTELNCLEKSYFTLLHHGSSVVVVFIIPK